MSVPDADVRALPSVTRRLPTPEERPTLRVDEVAPLLGLSEDSVRSGITNGELPAIRIGRRILVPTAALRRLLGLDCE